MVGGDLTYRERALAAEARVAELEAELVGWRELHDVAPSDEVFQRARTWLQAHGVGTRANGVARLLAFLLRHPGLVLSTPRVADAVSFKPRGERETDRVASVVVCYARQVLAGRGLDGMIETLRGEGYRLSEAHAARVRALIFGAAA